MQALDNDISETNVKLNEVYNQGSNLQNEIDSLTQQVQYMESNLQQTRQEEWIIRNSEEESKAGSSQDGSVFKF